MPTAARRRADAARKATPAPRAPAQPIEPPQPPGEPELEEGLAPDAWRLMAEAPPFDVRSECRKAHGPFELRLNARAVDAEPGEVVRAQWCRISTTNGGWGWGFRTFERPEPRAFGWAAVEAWRPA